MTLRREPSLHHTTMGSLYINGHWHCWTLEDELREVPGQPVSSWKVAGQTAIPAGTYSVSITPSVRFGVDLPLLAGVPGFAGIRIHAGNTIVDTEGCLLLGQNRSTARVSRSKPALFHLMETLTAVTEPITIRIENPEVS